MQDSVYHVLLEGRRVGPFDRRTIVGMCIRKALGRGDVVVDAQGRETTVRDLFRKSSAAGAAAARSASRSVVRGIHAATLVEATGAACCAVPPFSGPLEVRLQTTALRLEGRWREGLGWKQDRLKIPLDQVVHAAVRGSLVDLGLRARPGAALQRLTLDLLSPESAGDFAGALPHVRAWPADPVMARAKRPAGAGHLLAWAGAAGVTVLVGSVVAVVWMLTHR